MRRPAMFFSRHSSPDMKKRKQLSTISRGMADNNAKRIVNRCETRLPIIARYQPNAFQMPSRYNADDLNTVKILEYGDNIENRGWSIPARGRVVERVFQTRDGARL